MTKLPKREQDVVNIHDGQQQQTAMMALEEGLASKAEPILGCKPSSKTKKGPIGICICIIILVFVIVE